MLILSQDISLLPRSPHPPREAVRTHVVSLELRMVSIYAPPCEISVRPPVSAAVALVALR